MSKLQTKEKVIWYISLILSILLLILGVYLKIKEQNKYDGKTIATCPVRTRCTYTINDIDYIYQADYYTDVNPIKPIKREIRYKSSNPSESHLTEMGISESCIFIAISLIILNIMYFIMKDKVMFLGAGLLALFVSFLLYSPLLGTMNPFLYFKTFKYYGLSTLIPLIFFLGGILFIFLSLKRFVWVKKATPITHKQEREYVKETKEEREKRIKKEEKFDKNFDKIFNFIYITVNFIEAGIAIYAFSYMTWLLFIKEKFNVTPVGILEIGIFLIPIFLIFIVKVLDIIDIYLAKTDNQEKSNLIDKIKRVIKIILTVEILCTILFVFISAIIHENIISILFVSIGFILPIILMLVYAIYHFVLENSNIFNKEILIDNFDRIGSIIWNIFLSLFLLFGIIAVIAGMIYSIKEENYAILIFCTCWLVVLSIILYFVLKQFKKN